MENETRGIDAKNEPAESLSNSPHLVVAEVCFASTLRCERTFFRGFNFLVSVAGSDSSADVNACVINTNHFLAYAFENASLSITNSVIDCASHLLSIGANTKGKIKFLKNRLSATSPISFYIDRVSERPEQDLPTAMFEFVRFHRHPLYGPPDKEKSKYTNSVKNLAQQLGKDFNKRVDSNSMRYKRCQRCSRPEDLEALVEWASGKEAVSKEKFRYCGACRVAAYCSEECKVAHWVDHRLSCEAQKLPP